MHQIRYFLAVAETSNFTRAAQRCNVSQPAMTRAIQSLEAELGGLLLRRERNQTHLTDLGRLVLPHLTDVFTELDVARTTAQQFLKLADAPINLGVMCTVGPVRFAGFLAKFRHDNPGVQLTMIESVPGKLLEMMGEGKLDVAVLAQPEPLPERCDVIPLFRERYVAAFPPGHRFANLDRVRFRDMDGENILLRINCEYGDVLGGHFQKQNVKLKLGYRSEREDWVQIMIMAGLGVSVVPEYMIMQPGLHTRPLVEPEVIREVSVATMAGRRFSPAVATFVRGIKLHQW